MLNKLTSYTVHTTLIFASAILAPLTFAAQSDPTTGNTITINGCLHAGEHSGQYILSDVTSGGNAQAIYWLDSMSHMRRFIGQRVDVSGIVVKRDASNGSMKETVQPNSETKLNVRGSNDRGINAKFPGSTEDESTGKVSLPLYRVHVQSVAPLGAEGCR